jgi:hypothetical protein
MTVIKSIVFKEASIVLRQKLPRDRPIDIGLAIWTLLARRAKPTPSKTEDAVKTSRLSAVICAAALATVFQAGAARAELKKQSIDYKDGDKPARTISFRTMPFRESAPACCWRTVAPGCRKQPFGIPT